MICQVTALGGFDWQAFDPAKPETFIESSQNMLPLAAKFHRSPGEAFTTACAQPSFFTLTHARQGSYSPQTRSSIRSTHEPDVTFEHGDRAVT